MGGQQSVAGGSGRGEILDGRAIAGEIREEMKLHGEWLQKNKGVTPGLAVVLVGSRPDSATYVRMKKKAIKEVEFASKDIDLPETVTEEELLKVVEDLNNDKEVHAILVQLPLPEHINEHKVLSAIKLEKDADGFSTTNIGCVAMKGHEPLATPCTPWGCIEMLKRSGVEIAGKEAVVVGRSNIVGLPVALMLMQENATVTICHSRTKEIAEHVKQADIVIAAIGKPEFIKGDWIKPGAVVIDVGINSIPDDTKKTGQRLVGDVEFAAAKERADLITPVPGGCGPMTIAMLIKNTLNLARLSVDLPRLGTGKAEVGEGGAPAPA
mmetsp:Transcript_59147/g.158260  ORF Transcript_59147/g.158260 Transcript_59147/m.158260 type:complete len:324 (-) Transcript_59147:267-1238(-)